MVVFALCLLACGRTGLKVDAPDAPVDAGRDAGTDAGVDAGDRDAAPPIPPTVDCFGREAIVVELRSLRRDRLTHLSYGAVVVNPGDAPAALRVERSDGSGGVVTLSEHVAAPRGATRLEWPMELDELAEECDPSGPPTCVPGDFCRCEVIGCFCARFASTAPRNRARRIVSDQPVSALQVLPASAEGTTSADTSALIPTNRLGRRYVVAAWPTTIGPPVLTRVLPSFVTVVAARAVNVRVALHPRAGRVYTAEGDLVGASFERELGELEVLDLYSADRLADFSGTVIEADGPIAVFTGASSSDVPAWTSEARRRCCSDHLQTQLLPEDQLGRRHFVLVPPNRVDEINAARSEGEPLARLQDPIFVRVVAVEDGTLVRAGDAEVSLDRHDVHLFQLARPTLLTSSTPVAVLLALSGSQQALGDGRPALGDPSIAALPPVAAVPEYAPFVLDDYPFDYVVFGTDSDAPPRFDGAPASERCTSERAGPIVQHTCRLSEPSIGRFHSIDDGVQRDGPHFVEVEGEETSMLTVGYGSFISYLYPGCAAAR